MTLIGKTRKIRPAKTTIKMTSKKITMITMMTTRNIITTMSTMTKKIMAMRMSKNKRRRKIQERFANRKRVIRLIIMVRIMETTKETNMETVITMMSITMKSNTMRSITMIITMKSIMTIITMIITMRRIMEKIAKMKKTAKKKLILASKIHFHQNVILPRLAATSLTRAAYSSSL